MIALILALFVVLAPSQVTVHPVSDDQKREFIELLGTLPHKGEFFSDDAVKRAEPYLPVLFALNEKDIEKYDIYPFAAISRGFCDDKAGRDYAVSHFGEIRHPKLKLAWGAMLFDGGEASREIVLFLRDALKSKGKTRVLSEIEGPNYRDFVRRLNRPQATKAKRTTLRSQPA